jgi:hypothetical protein
MIAANFRKFPTALLQQLELRLDDTAQYFQDLREPMRLIWRRLLERRTPTKRPADPSWFTEAKQRAHALARTVRAACMPLEATNITA